MKNAVAIGMALVLVNIVCSAAAKADTMVTMKPAAETAPAPQTTNQTYGVALKACTPMVDEHGQNSAYICGYVSRTNDIRGHHKH